jgi:hypothetical protein
LNAAAVTTKSPTNSVAATASTLIYQKNLTAILVGMGLLEVNASASMNSEDLEENECNTNCSKEDDSSFHLEENESMQQVAQRSTN